MVRCHGNAGQRVQRGHLAKDSFHRIMDWEGDQGRPTKWQGQKEEEVRPGQRCCSALLPVCLGDSMKECIG